MTEVRLNKFIAQSGVCSRRKADELIGSGRVSINGKKITDMGIKVIPNQDAITIDGKAIGDTSNEPEQNWYIMLHKPIQVVCTVSDPQGRKTVLDVIPAKYKETRLYPIGRLDYFSEGLLLLTNDGELTQRMTHPKYHLPKVYQVTIREDITEEALMLMRMGMRLDDGTELAPVQATISPHNPHLLTLTLHQGVNRQIRRMCQDLGVTILTLKRVQIGPLYLGSLAKGSSRPLNNRELSMLYNAVGL